MRKKKTGLTEKQIRKSNITQMSVVATMVHNIVMKDDYGVCGLHPYLETRMGESRFVPGVLLQPWKFMELFGEDTSVQVLHRPIHTARSCISTARHTARRTRRGATTSKTTT